MHLHTKPLELAGSECLDIAMTQLGDPKVAVAVAAAAAAGKIRKEVGHQVA